MVMYYKDMNDVTIRPGKNSHLRFRVERELGYLKKEYDYANPAHELCIYIPIAELIKIKRMAFSFLS